MPAVSLIVDIVPAVLVAAALFAVFCIVRLSRGGAPHLLLWAAGTLLMAVGILLIVLRDSIDDWLSILCGNLAIIAAYVCLSIGILQFRGGSPLPDLLLALVAGAGFALVYFIDGDIDLRITAISLGVSAFAALGIYRLATMPQSFGVVLAVVSLALIFAVSVARIAAAQGLLLLPSGATALHGIALALAVVAAAGLAVALLTMSLPALRAHIAAAETRPEEPGQAAQGWRLAVERGVLVSPTGIALRLTATELLMLRALSGNDAPVRRQELNAAIGRDAENPKDRSVDILISRLRRKCGEAGVPLPISSVRGRGYVFRGELQVG